MTNSNERLFNFSAGPAVLPVPVLEQIRDEMLVLPGAGASLLEISHRSQEFIDILETTKADLRELLAMSDDYEILFLQGGSRLQFSMIPQNLLSEGATAEYIVTGSWGKYAVAESEKIGATRVLWDGKETNYDRLPNVDVGISPDAAYVHFTSNETIQGVQFPAFPTSPAPLVCDASSDFMCRPVDFSNNSSNIGLIYACAQKNAGPAGVTVVIIRKDLLQRSQDSLPGYLNFREHAEQNSLYNTPPTFGIYVVGLVAKWLKNDIGGLKAMEKRNREKAEMLYEAVDNSSGFYSPHAQTDCRSLMNVTFRLPSDEFQNRFLAGAAELQLTALKGHRSVGGIRASIYNAMPVEGVTTLRDFMNDFASKNG